MYETRIKSGRNYVTSALLKSGIYDLPFVLTVDDVLYVYLGEKTI